MNTKNLKRDGKAHLSNAMSDNSKTFRESSNQEVDIEKLIARVTQEIENQEAFSKAFQNIPASPDFLFSVHDSISWNKTNQAATLNVCNYLALLSKHLTSDKYLTLLRTVDRLDGTVMAQTIWKSLKSTVNPFGRFDRMESHLLKLCESKLVLRKDFIDGDGVERYFWARGIVSDLVYAVLEISRSRQRFTDLLSKPVLLYLIYRLLALGQITLGSSSRELRIPKSSLHDEISRLERMDIVKKIARGIYAPSSRIDDAIALLDVVEDVARDLWRDFFRIRISSLLNKSKLFFTSASIEDVLTTVVMNNIIENPRSFPIGCIDKEETLGYIHSEDLRNYLDITSLDALQNPKRKTTELDTNRLKYSRTRSSFSPTFYLLPEGWHSIRAADEALDAVRSFLVSSHPLIVVEFDSDSMGYLERQDMMPLLWKF